MTAILDTSFLFALSDQSDRNHQRLCVKPIQPSIIQRRIMVDQNTNSLAVALVASIDHTCGS